MNELLKLAKKAALEAGRAIMSEYDSFSVKLKEDNSPLTSADIAANEKIFEILAPSGVPICSEESVLEFSKREKAGRFWLVDPLDGTKEFVDKNGEFCVCIALIDGARPVLSAIFIPTTAELFYASSAGFFKEVFNENGMLKQILNLSKQAKNERTIYMPRRSKNVIPKQIAKEFGLRVQEIGSAIKFARLAEHGGVYARLSPSYLWDSAAGDALISLGGGIMLGTDSLKPIDYLSKDLRCPDFIALSEQNIHMLDDIINIIGKARK